MNDNSTSVSAKELSAVLITAFKGNTTQWIEPGFFTRVYYLFVVPFAIMGSLNLGVLLTFGAETHYEMLYQISAFAVTARWWAYDLLNEAIDAVSIGVFFAYALVGSLPFSFRFWKFRKSPAGRLWKARKRKAMYPTLTLPK